MRIILGALIASTLFIGCSKGPKKSQAKSKSSEMAAEVKPPVAAEETGDLGLSGPGLDLVWKRYRAFEDGLVQGLNLNKADFCLELGKKSCIDQTHLTVLGGNEPYESGQYERAQSPTILTAVAVDRVVLNACSKRLELDRAAGAKAIVFKHYPLTGPGPDAKQVEDQTGELYRRILARNPEAEEVKVMQGMIVRNLAPDKLALLMCFAVATSIENILL